MTVADQRTPMARGADGPGRLGEAFLGLEGERKRDEESSAESGEGRGRLYTQSGRVFGRR